MVPAAQNPHQELTLAQPQILLQDQALVHLQDLAPAPHWDIAQAHLQELLQDLVLAHLQDQVQAHL